MENEEYYELQKQEEINFDRLFSYLKKLKPSQIKAFMKTLNEYIEVQIKLENYSNQ